MADLYGTIFECDGKKAIRHRVQEQNDHTKCGKRFRLRPGGSAIGFTPFNDALEEKRCKKCYPITRKAKRWLTSSKKK